MSMSSLRNLALFAMLGLLAGLPAQAVPDIPQTITLDGKLYNGTSTTSGLSDPSVDVVVQILSADKTCILYEEEQTLDTSASDGSFNIQIGSVISAAKRSANDSNNPMALVFQNLSTIPAKGVGCVNPYTPSGSKERYVRLTVTPSGGAPDVLSPDMLIDSVPNALVAETLQGKDASGFLQLGNESLTQSNVENVFTNANYGVLTSLLAGSSPSYVQIGSSGANLPGFSSNPGAPATGSVWYDTSANVLKFYDGSQVQTVSENGHNAVQSVVAGTGLNGGTITSSGTISLANTTVSAGSFGSATQVPAFTVNAQGRLTAASNVAIAGLDASALTTGILPITLGGTGSNNGSIAGSGPLTFAAGGTNQNVILKPSGTGSTVLNGNVGINIAAPAALLHIRTTTLDDTVSKLQGSGSTNNYINFDAPNLGGQSGYPAFLRWTRDGGQGRMFSVYTTVDGVASNLALFADTSGNVGIGTNNPTAPLHVLKSDNGSIYTTTNNAAQMVVANYDMTTVNHKIAKLLFNSVSTNGWNSYGAIGVDPSNNSNSGDIFFSTSVGDGVVGNAGLLAERMRITTSGNVGIGTTSPATSLDVNGTARLAKYSSQPYACNATYDGAIAATSIYTTCMCKNGTGWVNSADGVSSCAWSTLTIVINGSSRNWSDGTYATSCDAYLRPSTGHSYSGSTGSGVYTIQPAGSAYNVYCDMTNDGGGWTLTMQMATDGTLGYGASYWTTAGTLNTSTLNPSANANAVYQAFNDMPGKIIRGCSGASGGCVKVPSEFNSTLSVFQSGFQSAAMTRAQMTYIFPPDDSTEPNCNLSGLNVSPSPYTSIRFGILGNNEGDCSSPDSSWGWGGGCGAGSFIWNSGSGGTSCTQGTLWAR